MDVNFKTWLEEDEQSGQTRAWYRYGNYCGPGPRLMPGSCDKLFSGRPLPKPMDDIDAQCLQHDIEYCQCGASWLSGLWGSGKKTPCTQQSDIMLVKNLQKVDPQSLKQYLAKRAIRGYFGFHTADTRAKNAKAVNPRTTDDLPQGLSGPLQGQPVVV